MKGKLLACLAASLFLSGCVSSLGDLQTDLLGGRPAEAQFAQMAYTTPAEIEAIYAENTLDADKKYAGKWTKVRGVIDVSAREYTDAMGKKTGYGLLLGEENKTSKTKFANLHCSFLPGKETEDLLRGLKRGQVVEIGGKLTEYKPTSHGPSLVDCVIVKVVK